MIGTRIYTLIAHPRPWDQGKLVEYHFHVVSYKLANKTSVCIYLCPYNRLKKTFRLKSIDLLALIPFII